MVDYMSNLGDFVGIPFVDRGRDYYGCDCMGLVHLIFKEYGIDIPTYDVKCDDTKAISEQFCWLYDNKESNGWAEIEEPEEPCLITFAIDGNMPDQVCHVGTYVGNGKFIHTIAKQGSSIVKIRHPFYRNKIKGFFKYEKSSSNGSYKPI
jgi:cell wall-associated NlpC family hydrolase